MDSNTGKQQHSRTVFSIISHLQAFILGSFISFLLGAKKQGCPGMLQIWFWYSLSETFNQEAILDITDKDIQHFLNTQILQQKRI